VRWRFYLALFRPLSLSLSLFFSRATFLPGYATDVFQGIPRDGNSIRDTCDKYFRTRVCPRRALYNSFGRYRACKRENRVSSAALLRDCQTIDVPLAERTIGEIAERNTLTLLLNVDTACADVGASDISVSI